MCPKIFQAHLSRFWPSYATDRTDFIHDTVVFDKSFKSDYQSEAVSSALPSVSLLLYDPKYTGPIKEETLTTSH